MENAAPWIQTLVAGAILFGVALIGYWIARHLFLRVLHHAVRSLPGESGNLLIRHRVFARLTYVIPLLILSRGIRLVPNLPTELPDTLAAIFQSALIVVLIRVASAALNVVNELYERRPDTHGRPIKGYLQAVRILLIVICGLLIVGTLLQRDVLTLLAGLGAVMAVLLLIFQNTILAMVASVQVSSYDMVRVGDWIEMPAMNADGYVIDVSLHTIKVQNWDKTITVIPTNRLLTDTFKNWRGMFESGGRRIKRSLLLDQFSIRFLTEAEQRNLHRFVLLDSYLLRKEQELAEWNQRLAEYGREPANMRRLTNLGTFRAYVEAYLRHHPGIHQHLTMLVRQRDPTPQGLPLELYCFTANTAWKTHEDTQSDIFDHLLAILPEFGLRVFQDPSGNDWRQAAAGSLAAHPSMSFPAINTPT